MSEGYLTLDLDAGKAYVNVDILGRLRRVAAVVFDCDGVLIDIRDSYNRAISKAVAYIFEALSGYSAPEDLISDEVISLFRRSGGFNNDWDTVYGILMFMLCDLPEKHRRELEIKIDKIGFQPDPFKRIASIREVAGCTGEDELGDEFLEGTVNRLKDFTELLDETGVDSVDRNLTESAEISEGPSGFFENLKRFLHYPGEVGKSIVSRVFEEFFCGSELFTETYGVEPRFHRGMGLIENELPIIRSETLIHLASIIGGANFGVASGSRFIPAEYVLGELLERFHPEACVFLDDVEKAEKEHPVRSGLNVNLKKPNPFSLLQAAEAFTPDGVILCVGDSMADAMMAREANKVDARFLFAGVYGYAHPKDGLISDFLAFGCDAVLPSVNELPPVLEWIGRVGVEER